LNHHVLCFCSQQLPDERKGPAAFVTCGHQTQTLSPTSSSDCCPCVHSLHPLLKFRPANFKQLRITCVQFFTVSLSGSSTHSPPSLVHPLVRGTGRLTSSSKQPSFVPSGVWSLWGGFVKRGRNIGVRIYLTRITEGKTGARRNHLLRGRMSMGNVGTRPCSRLRDLWAFATWIPCVGKGIETSFRCKQFWVLDYRYHMIDVS
jgi:hypothetical protein